MYYDRTRRDFQNGFIENLHTLDFDAQHRFALGRYQEIVWGLGVRSMEHQTANLQLFAFVPAEQELNLYSGFVQDELSLWDGKVRVTGGVKLEHNDYTGAEWQPNARFAWTPIEQQTFWAAASRAVRTPVRFDRDFRLSLTPTIPFIAGGDFQSETVHAYELGWRSQWLSRVSTSLATFYNEYDGLRSVEPGSGFLNLPVTFGNGVGGESYGAELSATYSATDFWSVRGGYTWMRKHLRVKPGSRDTNRASAEANDPDHQLLLQSILTLPHDIELDGVVRYVDTLSAPHVDSYVELDLHVAVQLTPELELTLVGQNLLEGEHAEFVPSSPSARLIERSVYGKITWRL
jgi:iron complex outermembrane receptor protein